MTNIAKVLRHFGKFSFYKNRGNKHGTQKIVGQKQTYHFRTKSCKIMFCFIVTGFLLVFCQTPVQSDSAIQVSWTPSQEEEQTVTKRKWTTDQKFGTEIQIVK